MPISHIMKEKTDVADWLTAFTCGTINEGVGVMTYEALDVANYVVNYSIEQECPVSNLKLQKLLYYIQAASLVERQKPAFQDEISAWTYGPVVEPVYHRFKLYANCEIDKAVTERELHLFSLEAEPVAYDPASVIALADVGLIHQVVDSYREKNALQMVAKTHGEEPWKNAHQKGDNYISQQAIKDYYDLHQGLIYGQ